MISVIIGDVRKDESLEVLYQEINTSNGIIEAGRDGAFTEFCKRAIRSTNILRIKDIPSDTVVTKVANDDIVVLFSDRYIAETKTPVLYKLATVIETSVDLGLKIQVFSLTDEKSWNPQGWEWPAHWPTISLFKV
jgi:hypothetical protein